MARRKSPAEVGPLGVWAYDTRDALDLSVEAVVAALPTTYHPATLRKVEGGSARPGTRMWRELGNLYAKRAAELGVAIDPQPRLAPEPAGSTETPDSLVMALIAQTAAIRELAAEIRLSRGEDAVTRQEMMRALGAVLAPRGRRSAGERDTPEGAVR
jgi:hypothetical protein